LPNQEEENKEDEIEEEEKEHLSLLKSLRVSIFNEFKIRSYDEGFKGYINS